jgi:hypothetical protein
MKLSMALWLLAGATIGLGVAGIKVSMAAESVATCEVAVNQKTLELLLLRQNEARMAVDVAERRTSQRINELLGRPQSQIDPLLDRVSSAAVAVNRQALVLTDQVVELLETGCEDQRSAWIAWSLLLTVLTAAVSCLALWVGLRVEASPASEVGSSADSHQ